MTGPDDAKRLGEVRAVRPGGDALPTPECLDEFVLAALADGTLEPKQRPAALAHLASCGTCRCAVASVARALADPEVASEVSAVEPAGPAHRRWLGQAAVGLTAAAALVLLVWPGKSGVVDSQHRAPPITASPAPEAVWPIGPVAEARTLRWTSVPGADRYRVTLFDADGTVRYEIALTDTMVALPDSVLPAPGHSYWWQVDARLGFDRWATSLVTEFSVGGGAPR